MERRDFARLVAIGGAGVLAPVLWPRRAAAPGRPTLSFQSGADRVFSDSHGRLFDVAPAVQRDAQFSPSQLARSVNDAVAAATLEDGRMAWVSKTSSQLTVLDRNGRVILRSSGYGSGLGQLAAPSDVAGHGNSWIVADSHNHRLQIFSGRGRPTRTFGTLGHGLGQLNAPSSVAVAPDGSYHVAEAGNVRIQVFAPHGRSMGTYGNYGRKWGEMLSARCIRFDQTGHALVADPVGGCVHIFDGRGRPVERIQTPNPGAHPHWLTPVAGAPTIVALSAA